MEFQLDQAALEAVFEMPSNQGEFAPLMQVYLGNLGNRRPSVFLAFPPKAAGTFLRHAAIKAVGGDLVRIVHAQGGRDAQPYLPTFIAYYHGGITDGPLVAHIHMQALPANIFFLEAFNIRPVIMVRSIPDMLASYWDMLEGSDSALQQGINCIIPKDFRQLSTDRKQDFLVDIIGPWYVGYYATWLEYAQHENDRVCALNYTDFLKQPASILEKLLQHAKLPCANVEYQKAIDAVWEERYDYRFNEGVEGRSHQFFSVRHFERIGKMLSYYPSTLSRRAELIGI